MSSSFKMPFCFDAKSLQADLEKIRSDEWVAHFNTGYFEGEWTGVGLRSVGGVYNQLYSDPRSKNSFADTPVLDRCPNVQALLKTFQCPLLSVRFLKLAAGSIIKEHRDYDLGFAVGELRFHVPIISNPDVDFYLDAQKMEMKEGECWYLDLSLPHWVENRGSTDRIHLVIDCKLNEWLRNLIPADHTDEDGFGMATSMDETSSSPAELERFRRAVLNDPQLQQRLRLTADRQSFIKLAVTVGREHGYCFTPGDVGEAMAAAQREWNERWID